MTETTVNVDLLERVMAHIENNPGQHNQGSWVSEDPQCGAQFCFAGWAVILDGVSPPPPGTQAWGVTDAKVSVNLMDYHSDEHVSSAPGYAQRALGLSGAQRGALFYGGNSVGDLRRMVDAIVAGQETHR